MKKIVKGIVGFAGIILGILVILVILFAIRFSKMSKLMSPSETMAINDSVFCIRDRFVNAYVFRGNTGYLMIDACLSQNNVASALESLGIDAGKVHTMILTHTDGDHTGALPLFPGANVWMHREEEQMINGTTAKGPMKTKWKYGEYSLFDSDQVIEVDGLTVKVMHVPGHTPGSCCFAIGNDYLVTGDNLLYKEGRFEHFIEMVNMDTQEQAESLKLLPAPENFRYILTGHNGFEEVPGGK